MVRTLLGLAWVGLRHFQADLIRRRHAARPTVFLFADSRAVDVRRTYTKRDPLGFYPAEIIRRYSVRPRIVPYRHTSIVDLIAEYETLPDPKPQVVVAHVGIVDFSPRPRRDASERVYASKKNRYDAVFGADTMRQHLAGDLGCDYEDQPTINMFSLALARERLVPRLRRIPGLVFVGGNRFVPGWNGNYHRGRPRNIAVAEEYSRLLCSALPHAVDFDDWTETDVRRFTVDNIHYTPEGAHEVARRILAAIPRVLAHDQPPQTHS